jgi:hypothetical protein
MRNAMKVGHQQVSVRPYSTRNSRAGVSYLHFPLHGVTHGNDAAAAVFEAGHAKNNGAGRTAPAFASSSLPLVGGTTDIWVNAGSFTPGTQQCSHRDTTAALRNFLRLDTLAGTGCMAVALRFFHTAAPSGDEYILDSGVGTTNEGGFGIRFNSLSSLSWFYDPIVGTVQAPGKTMSSLTNQWRTMFFWLNGIDAQLETWDGGVQNGTPTAMNGGTAQFPAMTTFETNRGLVLFGRKNEADTTIISHLGNAGSGVRISDLMVIRLDYDARAEKSTAIAQLVRDPTVLPLVWTGR